MAVGACANGTIVLFCCLFCFFTALIHGLEPEFLYEPSSRLVKLSDGRAVFRCEVSPSSADVRWLWKGQLAVPNRWIKLSKHKLTVHLNKMDKNSRTPLSAENGAFQCEARLRGKVLVSAPAELIVAVLEPFPTQSDVHISVVRGNTAVIPCKMPYSVPTVVTEVQFNNVMIDKSTSRLILMPSGNLQILNSELSDSGQYVCIAYNPYLAEKVFAHHKVFLNVIESAKIDSPRFVVPPQPVTSIALGSNVTLECAASGHPTPFITWKKRHGHLPKSRYQQVGGNLILLGVCRGDEGEYVCQVENSLGTRVYQSTVLEVQETPEIVKPPRDILLNVGENLTLDCAVQGHPKPLVNWLHNGKTLTKEHGEKKESKIVFRNVTLKHSGIYQCFATNNLGTVYAKSSVIVSTGNKSLDADYENEDYDDYDQDGLSSPKFHHWKTDELNNKDQESNFNGADPNSNSGIGVNVDSSEKRHHKKKKLKNGVRLVPPSRPEVSRLSDNSVMVRWGVPRNDGLPILFFKVQYREVDKKNSHWMTIDEDIAAHIHSYAVTELRNGGKYRFRIAAVYSNNDNKLGPNSQKFVLYKDPPMKKPSQGPVITHAEAASPSAITLHWEYMDLDSITIEGFFIYYRTTHSAGDYLKVTVLGANTRSHIISHLLPDTGYDIKTQCFNIAGTSEFSNIYTCKTKPSENIGGIRGRNSKSQYEDEEIDSDISKTEPVSSKDGKNNIILDIVLGVICSATIIAIIVFLTLYIRQRINRHENPNCQQTNGTPGTKITNGHIVNGYIPVNGININVNPLSHLDDTEDMSEQEETNVSNNNKEIIQLRTFKTNELPPTDPLLAQETNEIVDNNDLDVEEQSVILNENTETNFEAPRSI